ncbi:hypothetical protein ACJX0J_018520, partial [Zea mays]
MPSLEEDGFFIYIWFCVLDIAERVNKAPIRLNVNTLHRLMIMITPIMFLIGLFTLCIIETGLDLKYLTIQYNNVALHFQFYMFMYYQYNATFELLHKLNNKSSNMYNMNISCYLLTPPKQIHPKNRLHVYFMLLCMLLIY